MGLFMYGGIGMLIIIRRHLGEENGHPTAAH